MKFWRRVAVLSAGILIIAGLLGPLSSIHASPGYGESTTVSASTSISGPVGSDSITPVLASESEQLQTSSETSSQTSSSQSSGQHPIETTNQQDSGVEATKSPRTATAVTSTSPGIDYGDILNGNKVTYTGGTLSVPVLLTLPRAGLYFIYLELWANRRQVVQTTTVTAATNRQKFMVEIPAEYMPQYSDQLSGFNLYVGDDQNNFSDPLHYVLSLDVPNAPSEMLGVVAPKTITFNPSNEPLNLVTAWHQKFPARIVPVDDESLGANTLSVLDDREGNSQWSLTVSASRAQQLTGADHDYLQDAMHYLHNGKDRPINDNQVLVAGQGEYPSESIHDVDYHIYTEITNISTHWDGANSGLFLEVPIGTGGGEAYSGSLTWRITDGVANK